jgi:hypothetical protein
VGSDPLRCSRFTTAQKEPIDMCNFIPLRDALTALGILAGLAATSAVFAFLWASHGGIPFVTTISFSMAATWCLAALITLYFAMKALTTFCNCASKVTACAMACSVVRPALFALIAALTVTLALCFVAAGDPTAVYESTGAIVGLLVAACAILGIVGLMGIYASRLSSCQA